MVIVFIFLCRQDRSFITPPQHNSDLSWCSTKKDNSFTIQTSYIFIMDKTNIVKSATIYVHLQQIIQPIVCSAFHKFWLLLPDLPDLRLIKPLPFTTYVKLHLDYWIIFDMSQNIFLGSQLQNQDLNGSYGYFENDKAG